jgi:hypothetical protein
MDHGRTQHLSGMGESMSHGRTNEVACQTVAGNPVTAIANSDLQSTGHSTNGHGDRRAPALVIEYGHTCMAPDKDAHTHIDNGHSSHS